MKTFRLKNATLSIDFNSGKLASFKIKGKERLFVSTPLFKLGLLDKLGEKSVIDSFSFTHSTLTNDGAIFSGAINEKTKLDLKNLTVTCFIKNKRGELNWKIKVAGLPESALIEWINYPCFTLPSLIKNNPKGGEIVYPYNEGVLVNDENVREKAWFNYCEPAYPSEGNFGIFPNMVCSQFISYLWSDYSLYIGAHDPKRGVKHIDYFANDGGVTLIMRTYCGCNFGQDYLMSFPIVTAVADANWTSPCERYRSWLTAHLPKNVKKITKNPTLPAWYFDNPLIVSYPVRGIHDMDEMTPNAFYPYTNALPVIEDIQSQTGAKIMALLMHWEGTAPWAPPYVWPPYGDLDDFMQFKSELAKNGNLLGVYCSGFGYTIQSNLITEYNMLAEYHKKGLSKAMCVSEKGEITSKICTAQRQGYDICPASKTGKRLLEKAYYPLFKSGLDYAQILDQNHGGGQYFCYSSGHGHPPAPGEWMTINMQKTLNKWNKHAPNMLFGCESSASEPFIGNLLFSDNRFELGYMLGRPVPVFAYLYHEYLRNFMGNQVCNTLSVTEDTLRYRLAYSFSIGDAMTLVLSPDGGILPHWGYREKTKFPDTQKTLTFIKNMTKFYNEQATDFLCYGKMIPALAVECDDVTFKNDEVGENVLPKLLTSAWENEKGEKIQIIVNPFDYDVPCVFNDSLVIVPAMQALRFDLK